MKWKAREVRLRYKDLELDDVLFDSHGLFFRVMYREEDRYSKTHGEVIVPLYRLKGILNCYEASGSGQNPGREFNAFEGAEWIWHSRYGCLIP